MQYFALQKSSQEHVKRRFLIQNRAKRACGRVFFDTKEASNKVYFPIVQSLVTFQKPCPCLVARFAFVERQ